MSPSMIQSCMFAGSFALIGLACGISTVPLFVPDVPRPEAYAHASLIFLASAAFGLFLLAVDGPPEEGDSIEDSSN